MKKSGYEEEIVRYFVEGFSYVEIIELLNRCYNYSISLSTLKRFFKKKSPPSSSFVKFNMPGRSTEKCSRNSVKF